MKIVYIDCLSHTLLDESLEGNNVNLSHLQSLENLQLSSLGIHNLYIWIQFVQTLGTSCIYNIFG